MVIVVLLAVSPARADGFDHLREAERLKAALEWDKALAEVRLGIEAGGNSVGLLAQLYALEGTLLAGLERPGDAVESFGRALALSPDTFIDEGSSPTIEGPYRQARARTGALRFHVTQEQRGGELAITVHLDDDRWNLVARARVGEVTSPASGGRVVVLVASATAPQSIELLDEHGNVVGFDSVEPLVAGPSIPERREPYERPSWPKRVEVWGALTLVTGALAGVFAWRADVAQDEWRALRAEDGEHDFSELAAVEARGRRHTDLANLFGVFAVAGGVITAVRGVGELAARKDHREGRAQLLLTGDDDELGFAIAGSF